MGKPPSHDEIDLPGNTQKTPFMLPKVLRIASDFATDHRGFSEIPPRDHTASE